MRACTPTSTRALGAEPPEYIHHGLLVGEDGTKLSKRHWAVPLAELRDRGIPPEALRRYLEELGLPRGDVHLDETRIRRLAVEALGALPDDELAARAGVDASLAPLLRGAHDLVEARELARQVTERPPPSDASPETLARFRELRARRRTRSTRPAPARWLCPLRESGGDLKALRPALTGQERGPELWAVVLTLPRDEAPVRAGAELRLHLLDGGEERADRPGRHAATSTPDRDELVARRLCVSDLDLMEQPDLELPADARLREEGDAEPLLHHLLGGVDVVQLHRPLRPHAGVAGRARSSAPLDAVELDELLVSDLDESDARPLRERMVGMGDEHESVLVQRRRDDLRVTQRSDEPEVDLLPQDEVEHVLGVAGADGHAHARMADAEPAEDDRQRTTAPAPRLA